MAYNSGNVTAVLINSAASDKKPNVFLQGASGSNNTVTVGTCPANRKWHVLSYSLTGYNNSTAANNSLTIAGSVVEYVSTLGTAGTLMPIYIYKVFSYSQAPVLTAGQTITSISSSAGSAIAATAQIYEEVV